MLAAILPSDVHQLDRVEGTARRDDARVVLAMMQQATGEKPEMWGASIVGFGRYRNTLANGQVDLWPVVGFSPRTDALTLYIVPEVLHDATLAARLGKYKTGTSCLYIKKLSDVHLPALERLIVDSVTAMADRRVAP